MKLFKCKNCGTIDNSALANIIVRISVKIDTDEKFYVNDFDRHINGEEAELLDEQFRCHNCDKECVEIIEVIECPHRWRIYRSDAERTCLWCGVEQTAKLIWEK